jgi:hypothetical protein
VVTGRPAEAREVRVRAALAGDADLAGAVLRILLRVIHRALRDSAGAPLPAEAWLGAVPFLHRFGSALNPHPHFHLAVTDRLFARRFDDSLVFHPASRLDAANARSLTPLVQRRILRLYVRRGLLIRADADDMLRWRGTGGFSLDGSVRVAPTIGRASSGCSVIVPGRRSRSTGCGTPHRTAP